MLQYPNLIFLPTKQGLKFCLSTKITYNNVSRFQENMHAFFQKKDNMHAHIDVFNIFYARITTTVNQKFAHEVFFQSY